MRRPLNLMIRVRDLRRAALRLILRHPCRASRRRRRNIVRQRDISRSAETAYISAVFILHAEEGPHSAAQDFSDGDDEGCDGRVLELEGDEGIEDPVEPENWIYDHGDVVCPYFLVAEGLAEEFVFGVEVTKRPVHDHVPNTWRLCE